MTERASPVDAAAPSPTHSSSQEATVYRTITQPRQSHFDGSMPRPWNTVADKRRITEASEHGQLVEAIHATDGITREQAELQVTAFETLFKDEPQ
jgi:hypothetical protein